MMLPYRLLMPLRGTPPWMFSPLISFGRWVSGQKTTEYPLKWFTSFTPPADRALIERIGFEKVVQSFSLALNQGAEAVMTDADAYFEHWPIDWASYDKRVDFWHGSEDTNIPCRMARAMCERLPKGAFHELKGEGHYSTSVLFQREIFESLLSEGR